MRVRVHDGRHDGLAPHVHHDSIGRGGHVRVRSDLHQQPVPNKKGGVLDDPAVSDDHAGAAEQQGTSIVLRTRLRLAVDLHARRGAKRHEAYETLQFVHAGAPLSSVRPGSLSFVFVRIVTSALLRKCLETPEWRPSPRAAAPKTRMENPQRNPPAPNAGNAL